MTLAPDQRTRICELAVSAFWKSNAFRKSHLKSAMKVTDDPTSRQTIEALSDETLLGLADYLDADIEDDPRWPQPGPRLFVSHVSSERARLAELKNLMAAWSINFFLAHDDIEDGKPWAQELQRALREMEAFATVHSKGFAASDFCHQEAGFALAREVPLLTIMDGETPLGFLNPDQAIRWNDNKELAARLFTRLANHDATAARVGEGLARQLKRARHFAHADGLASDLEECKVISPRAAKDIRLAYYWNDQVHESGNGPRLAALLTQHKHETITLPESARFWSLPSIPA